MEPNIKEIIASAHPLPQKRLVIGDAWAEWIETQPGKFRIISSGPTDFDTYLVRSSLQSELKRFGYTPDIFKFAEADPTNILDRGSMDVPEKGSQDYKRVQRRLENRNKIEEEAQYMASNGFVKSVSTNLPDYVKGNVESWTRPKSYQTEIWRDGPYSNILQGFNCQCEWGTFCRDRAPQYRWLQDLPCKHAMALNIVSQDLDITNMEGQIIGPAPNKVEKQKDDAAGAPPVEPTPTGAPGGPPGGALPGEVSPFAAPGADALPEGRVPSVPRGPEGLEQLRPFKPEDVGATSPDEILEQRLGPLAPTSPAEQRDLTEEEKEQLQATQRPELQMGEGSVERNPIEDLLLSPNNLPESPYQKYKREQKERERNEAEYADPGTWPYGSPAPNGTVSVPGARDKMFNYINSPRNPWDGGFETWSKVKLNETVPARLTDPKKTSSTNWIDIPTGAIGLITGPQDAVTGLIEAEFKSKTGGKIKIWLEPEQLSFTE